jgi:peptidoglycan-associated lipoprotein
MTRLHLLVVAGLAATAVVACGGGPKPQTAAAPVPSADSIAAATERARQDSIAAAQAEADRQAREEAERVARQRAADSAAAAAATSTEVKNALAALIHFDFDKSTVRPEDAASLDQKVAILQANPDLRIRISGHCDERGSDEYNLALGNRRATAAKAYLVSHGVDAGRIETSSYGEERPIAQGHDEDAWSQNRRDEFEILAGGDVLKKP